MADLSPELQEDVNAAIASAMVTTMTQLGRRDALRRAFAGLGGLISLATLGQACRSLDQSATQATPSGPAPTLPARFQDHVKMAEAKVDAEFKGKPTPQDAKFVEWAKKRGAAVGQVIGIWLALQPYKMLQELLDEDINDLPIFCPEFGPVIVFRHAHVIECLGSDETFSVAPYAREMKRATEGEFNPQKFSHFILGTDQPGLYDPDSLILRSVMNKNDMTHLRKIIRDVTMDWIAGAKNRNAKKVDVVKTLCRYVPIAVCDKYLGFNVYEKGKPAFAELVGGGTFKIDDNLKKSFTFKITEGKVPTRDDLYLWIKDAFRNIFNNVTRDPNFESLGIKSTEYQVAYTQALINYYKPIIAKKSSTYPDTMLTRLIVMQLKAAKGELDPKAFGLATKEELQKRLTDARIRENLIGTVTGAGVNPEEGMARVIDALLNLKSTDLASFKKLQEAAAKNDMPTLNRAMLELLRLNPQGEVLLRLSTKEYSNFDTKIMPGRLVFCAHGAAMRDKAAIKNPMVFDLNRDPMLKPWKKGADQRASEAPQSQIYLQHGYGRHKCLGRYVSELTMEEGLRGILLLGDITRGTPLKMDPQNLYAESLEIGFTA